MELDNDGTEKDNEERQQTEPDATMATGDGSNEFGGEDPRNNGNGDINDCSEERKDSNNEGGGGGIGGGKRRASGRGRGRYKIDIRDDKGGRGGNHSEETKGGGMDTSHTSTTTLVVHQNDNTAQSKGKNEHGPTANGKPDNVSISPQQTGAVEDAAG